MKQLVKIKNVKPNKDNPRIIKDYKFDKLVNSIKEFPDMLEKRPIVVDEDMIVLGGNMRLKACIAAGLNEVWIDTAEGWTEEQKKEFIVKDNLGFGEWDWDILANEWDIQKLDDWGMDLPPMFDDPEPEAIEDDYTEPDNIKVDVVLGDLIEIGEHRLLCGDSTDSDQVAKLMNNEKANMTFTDPPYLMDFTGGIHADGSKSFNSKHGAIKNDKMSKKEGDDFLDSVNTIIKLFTKGAFYICFYRLKLGDYFESLKRTGLDVRCLITWNKGNHTLSNSDYMSKCEHIFYGWVKEHNFYGGNNGMDIWEIPRTQKNELHPTMKPIQLCEKAINDASKSNDIILDLFLGSGSTMVASHQLGRKCYGMELDPKYCQVIIDRMLKLNPNLEVNINGKKYERVLSENV